MDPNTAKRIDPRQNGILWLFLALAIVALAIDLMDGDGPKAVSSALIVAGLVALALARRYRSSRWRIVMLLSFTLAVGMLVVRLAYWHGWL